MASSVPAQSPVDPAIEKGHKILDKLEEGPWPSYVKELRQSGYPIDAYAQGLGSGTSPWFGGSARIPCVFVGFIARRTRDGKNVELHFRVYHPSGQIYKTSDLRTLLDISDKYGLGTVEAVGQTGDMIMPMKPEMANQAVDELRKIGTDLGGTGDTFRDTAVCVGSALCEYALFDSLAVRDYFFKYPEMYNKLSTQLFPFKIKLKVSACPLDCSRAVHRSDFGFVGFWEGAPEIDSKLFQERFEKGEVCPADLEKQCPGKAISWDQGTGRLTIDGKKCQKSMNCIRKAFPAIKPGKNRKIAFMIGGNAKGRFGPKMTKPVAVLDKAEQAGPFMVKLIEYWSDRSPHKDRLGDLLVQEGVQKTIEKFKGELPVELSGSAPGAPRIVNSSVLNDAERKTYSDWAEAIVREYEEAKP